jgi:hypothetical protein
MGGGAVARFVTWARGLAKRSQEQRWGARAAGLAARGWRRGWRPGVAGLVALAGLALLTLGPAAAVAAWQEHAEQRAQVRSDHHVGDPVQDGRVTFVVHEVRCGAAEESTHGQRCEVLLGARNDGADDVTVPARAQTLHVLQGARHLPTTAGTGRFDSLGPQQTATEVISFDLPLDTTVTWNCAPTSTPAASRSQSATRTR